MGEVLLDVPKNPPYREIGRRIYVQVPGTSILIPLFN